ncbi:hypothetical protein V2J09_020527 [Rumex salicifolius]
MVSETEITTDNQAPTATENMAANGDTDAKRGREGVEAEDIDVSKKQKVDDSVKEGNDGGEGEAAADLALTEKMQEDDSGPVTVGPKTFASSLEMFDYFLKFIHHWSPNIDVNKFEHLVLLDLIKKGHSDPEKKIGVGAKAFQIRFHPVYKSRCFFIVRNDESVDDFSFRKCVDHILPLPENMKLSGGDRSGHRGGGGRGRGRGGRGGHYRR